MDVNKGTADRAESVVSDILISDSCIENIISRLDSYEKTSSEDKCNQPQPLSESDPCQKTEPLRMDQEKAPVLPSSRCSVYSLNLSQDSTQSTLPPPVSQQSSSGFPLSMRNNTFRKDFPAYGESSRELLKPQRLVNRMSEPSKMKQIKGIHNYLHRSLKNSNALNQSDKNLLANAKQLLFSIKHHHAVLCDSLKASCRQQTPSNKSRQALKKTIGLLQNRQHKLLLLFQEHNIITKKFKMLDSNWDNNTKMALKGQSLPPSLMSNNLPSFSQSKSFPNKFITTLDDSQSESASTIYSFDCSRRMRPKFKKGMKKLECSALSKSQQRMSKSAMISKNKMNSSSQQPMSESAMISNNKMNQSSQQSMSESAISKNKINSSSQQPMSESAMISNDKMNQSSQQSMSESAISKNKINSSSQQPMSESAMISNNKMNQSSQQSMSESAISKNKINSSSQQPMSESAMISNNKMNQSSQESMSESAMISKNKINSSSLKPMSESAMISNNKMNQSSQESMSESAMISKNKINSSSQQPMSESAMISNNKMNQSSQESMSESAMISKNKINSSSQQPMSELAMISNNKMNQSSQESMSESAMISKNKINSSSQQPMSELAMISNNKMNHSKNNFSHGSYVVIGSKLTQINAPHQTLVLNNESSSWLNKNDTSNDSSFNLLPNMSTNCKPFTAIPIGTTADFTPVKFAKNVIQAQQHFGNNQLVSKPAAISARQKMQNSAAASRHLQNIPVPSGGGDVFCTSTNISTVTANGARLFETRETKESQEEFSIDKSQESTEENEPETNSLMEKASFDEANCEITTSLTHLTIIEDRELVPLDCILPSCQETDTFGSIDFPKFLWEGFYKWP